MFGLCRSRFYQPVGRGAPLARLAVLASFVAAMAATPALAQNTPPPEKSGSLPQTAKETGVNVTRLVGATVVNAQHQFIGVVDDLIVSQDRIDKAVVGLSGSLGIGEKDISVPFTELSLQTPVSAAQGTAASPGQSSGSLSLLLPMTMQQIVDAPPFTSPSPGGAIGTPSGVGGTPESIQKEPKSSTHSGGPG
jgi:PRC-barrel domain protein